jgi:hypothetical protein
MTDPSFLENMRRQVRQNLSPVSAPKAGTLIKRQETFFKKAITWSLSLHGALFVFFVVGPVAMSVLGLKTDYSERFQKKEFRNAIRVDIVGLPTLTLQELQKVDPTQEVSTAPPAAKVEAPPPAPSETAMKMPTKTAPPAPPPRPSASARKAEQERLERLRASLRVEQRRQELARQFQDEGAGGRAALAGNLLSEGYSVTGGRGFGYGCLSGPLESASEKKMESTRLDGGVELIGPRLGKTRSQR